jgi:hypothetical protein
MIGEFAGRALLNQVDDKKAGTIRDALLSDMELPFRKTFYPLGFAVEVLTNDQDVLVAADESFGHIRACRADTPLQIRVGISDGIGYETPLEPIRREFNHMYLLMADTNNQALLDLKTGTNFAWLSRSALSNRLYLRHHFLEKMVYLLLGAWVVTDIHAACVGKNGHGILLCGDSGAGKSTLAYACARSGWTYTSDDTCYLQNSSQHPIVIGHAHRVRFRPTAKDLFPELRDHEVTPRMEGKPSIEVPASRLPISSMATDSDVRAIVYLNRSADGEGKLVRLPGGTATRRLCEELYSAGEIRAEHEKLLEVFSNTPTYELQYHQLDDAIRQLEYLVQGGSLATGLSNAPLSGHYFPA